MEIILQSNFAYLSFEALTEEEKKGYILEVEKEIKEQFKKINDAFEQFKILTKNYSHIENSILDSLNSLKQSPRKMRTSKEYELYSHKISNIIKLFFEAYNTLTISGDPLGSTLSTFGSNPRSQVSAVRCSLLIAKKGNDIVRYLAFKNDPIVTITGPNATSLKSALENLF
jgi:hypothetical protein